jgi:Na+:H+ antiporter, NhaA family
MNHHRTAIHPHVAHRHRQRTLAWVGRVTVERFLLIPIGALIALLWSNLAPESYFQFAHRVAFYVNEIGMALFFALLAQEVYEATMPGGALHSWRRWGMPVVAALGGIAGAITVFLAYVNWQHEPGWTPAWPIACAIDAAATFYVLKTIMPHHSALPFAVLLAIVSDLVGMAVVAPRPLVLETQAGGVALVIGALVLATLMRVFKVRAFWPYILFCGTLLWIAFDWEGLHPAFSLLPLVPFMPHEPRSVDVFAEAKDDDRVHHAEREWHLLVQPIVFLFALVNAGVPIRGYDTGTWAMLIAAVVGRPLGMLLAVGAGLAVGLHLPRHLGVRELLVIALATSSGFSLALFFATGLLATGPVLAAIKVGVLLSASGALLAFAAARVLKVGRFAH